MSVLKFVNGKNNSRKYLSDVMDYICDPVKTGQQKYVDSVGCFPKHALADMMAVKKVNHKTHGKQGEHFVLSLTPDNPYNNDEFYMELADEIIGYFSKYQCIYALHKDTEIRHLHFVMNSVAYTDGKKFSQSPSDLNNFKLFCNRILDKYKLDLIRTSNPDLRDSTPYTSENGFDFLEVQDDYPEPRKPEVCIDIFPDDDLYEEAPKREVIIRKSDMEYKREVTPMNNYQNNSVYPTYCPTPPDPVPTSLQQYAVAQTTSNAPLNQQLLELDLSNHYIIRGNSNTQMDQMDDMFQRIQSQITDNSVAAAKLCMAMADKLHKAGVSANVRINSSQTFTFDLLDEQERAKPVIDTAVIGSD